MKKPSINCLLILTGTKNTILASEFFKKYFFAKDRTLAALEAKKELTRVFVRDKQAIEELETIIDKRIAAYSAKDLETSAKLKEEEWALIGKLSKLGDEFVTYHNRSSSVFDSTRVYLAFREQTPG